MNRFPKSYLQTLALFLFLTLVLAHSTEACSVFCIDKGGSLVVGRNQDWFFGEGMVVVNKRNQTKTAFRYWEESGERLARWTSKYGSITFVQYGREIAFGGMNEAGLVVQEQWLEESVYPAVDDRDNISIDQVIQYMLDNFQTVDEIASNIHWIGFRSNSFTKVHFFAVDRTGQCIMIEFIQGKMMIYTKDTLPVKVMTNDTYERSLKYLKGEHLNGITSLGRFATAASMVSSYEPTKEEDAVPYAFNILGAVSQGYSTKFQTVYDIKNRVIYFKSLHNSKVRYFRFDSFDFSPGTPSKVLDLNADLFGDVTAEFVDYTTVINEDLIKKAWEDMGTINIYLPALQLVSRYPETFINN